VGPLVVLIGLALIFNMLNGLRDSSTIVATIISSRAMSPRWALGMAAAAEFMGPFIFGVAVARTIGKGLVDPQVITPGVVMAALLSTILWGLLSWRLGIPSSSSHALVGGLIGAVTAGVGFQAILIQGLAKVILALFISPILGFLIGFLITRLVFYLARGASLRINSFFKRAQIATGLALALGYGANDGQKSIGMICLSLVVTGAFKEFIIPVWVIVLSGLAVATGATIGEWRLIRTLGARFYKIRPVDGFCTQVSSAGVILTAALFGGPVSTTQVISTAILGVGCAGRASKVRWQVMGSILGTWVLTIPATFGVAYGLYLLIALVIK
jgi:inorganic phosphate transporter, PiT family